MKKILKLFLISIWSFPLIIHANIEKEVNKYIEVEENIHYEKDVEQICEYYDKSNYINGDWIYTFKQPEVKEYREIIEEVKNIEIERNIINILKILSFDGYGFTINLHELTIQDKNGNKLNYQIENLANEDIEIIEDKNDKTFIEINRIPNIKIIFNEPQKTKNIVIDFKYSMESAPLNGLSFSTYINEEIFSNAYDNSGTFIENNCIDELCHMKISIDEEKMYEESITIKEIVYKYRDKYYKCYTPKNIDLEEIINNLGYIKKLTDESKQDKEKNLEVNLNEENKHDKPIENKKPLNVIIEEIKENINQENQKLAILTKTDKKNKNEHTDIYITSLIILLLLIIGIIFTKKVIKCRTK